MSKVSGCPSGLKRYENKVEAEKAAEDDGSRVEVKRCTRCKYGWHIKTKGRRRAERKAKRNR